VDFVLAHGNKIIPIEVKSGATGRLRSLHQFINYFLAGKLTMYLDWFVK